MTTAQRLAAALLVLSQLPACGAATESSAAAVHGEYHLLRINGSVLPFDTGPLPPRPGMSDDCHVLITTGSLTIDTTARRYDYSYRLVNSCTQATLGTSGSSGAFSQSGGSLSFTAALGGGSTKTFVGEVRGPLIYLADDFYAYQFQR